MRMIAERFLVLLCCSMLAACGSGLAAADESGPPALAAGALVREQKAEPATTARMRVVRWSLFRNQPGDGFITRGVDDRGRLRLEVVDSRSAGFLLRSFALD